MARATKVVMFTDEVNSTARNEERTDDERTRVAEAQFKLTSAAVLRCRGDILKDTGDGYFVEFPSCTDAVMCGYVLQKTVTEHNQAQTKDLLTFGLHIGIDSGDLTVLENGELRGTAAARASRISGKCPAGEVYFSSKIADELNPREEKVEEVGQYELKGLRELVRIYRLAAWLTKLPPKGVPIEPPRSVAKVIRGPGDAGGPPTLLALHQLPPPPGDFTGREAELRKLLSAVEQGGVTISGLRGMGGIGKTALALKLAEQLRPRYPDAQIYFDLKGTSHKPLAAAEAMAHVIRSFRPDYKPPEHQAGLAADYHSVLDGKRALLLMDNAREAAQVLPLLSGAPCVMLVTSRWHFTLPGWYATDLSALPPRNAQKLLHAIAPRIKGHAKEIAKLCGFLPLALRAAASAIAETPNLNPADYAQRLEQMRRRLELRDSSVDQTVDASLALSYDLLGPDLQRQFRALAVFPETFDVDGAAAVWATKRDPAQDSLGDLLKYSLLEWNSSTARYRLHDLVRAFADARLNAAERETTLRLHAAHYRGGAAKAGELYLKGGEGITRGLALFDVEWPNIQAGQAWASEHAERDKSAGELCSQFPALTWHLLGLRMHPSKHIQWLEAALAAARRLKDPAAEGVHLDSLGLAYADLGETRRAIEYHKKALAIDREIGDRRAQGQVLGNLGLAYDDLGETRRAIEYHEKALAIDREIGDRRGEGQDWGNLGSAYVALGETRHAIEFYEQHLVIAREIGDRQGEGNALGGLGCAYEALGETRRAIEFFEQQLVIDREIGHRRGEGNALGGLGLAYADLGETRHAIEFYEQQLVIAGEIGHRRGEGNALWNMSLALDQLGDRAQAMAHADAALRIYEAIEDPYAAKVRAALARWRGQA